MQVLAISNAKGGVGKTTTALNLAAEMAQTMKVVLIDLDPQSSLTFALGIDKPDYTVVDALDGKRPIELMRVTWEGKPLPFTQEEPVDERNGAYLMALPGSLKVIRKELEIAQDGDAFHKAFDSMIRAIRTKFAPHLIVIDCPPGMGLLHAAAIRRAGYILSPIEPDVLALKGYIDYRASIDELTNAENAVVLTKFDSRKVTHRSMDEMLTRDMGGALMSTKVRANVALAEAPAKKLPARIYNPKSTGAQDYQTLTENVIDWMNA